MSLDGKRVIVIGGASGIVFAVAALSRPDHDWKV
jgi:NAD(P)-dependent dehydrogenase (short-subunit alcohol dehydrogenase family)